MKESLLENKKDKLISFKKEIQSFNTENFQKYTTEKTVMYMAYVDEDFLCLLTAIKSINDHFMEGVFEGLWSVV